MVCGMSARYAAPDCYAGLCARGEFVIYYVMANVKGENGMGAQINYYIGYADFRKLAEEAVKCGCVIWKAENGTYIQSGNVEIITPDCSQYYFYVPDAGELEIQARNGAERIGGYNPSGNLVIEAGYSFIRHEQKSIASGRLYTISGFYDEAENWVARPACVKKVYDRLVRFIKKTIPCTEIVDEIVSISSEDYLQTKEWRRKEYISAELLSLKLHEGYKLVL